MSSDRFRLIPAVYLILRRDKEVLLLRRQNTGYQDGKYSFIAGHLDGNELATEGLVREAKEEAGITIKATDLKFVHMAHRLNRGEEGQERVDLFFELWNWEGEITNIEPDKCLDLTWYPLDNLSADTIPLIRNVLRDVGLGTTYSEYESEP